MQNLAQSAYRIVLVVVLVLIVAPNQMEQYRQFSLRSEQENKSITDAERKYVREQILIALAWFAKWYEPRTCGDDKEATIIDLQKLLSANEGKEIRVLLAGC